MSHPDIATAADDYRRFETLMIELAALVQAGHPSDYAPRIADTAEIFRVLCSNATTDLGAG